MGRRQARAVAPSPPRLRGGGPPRRLRGGGGVLDAARRGTPPRRVIGERPSPACGGDHPRRPRSGPGSEGEVSPKRKTSPIVRRVAARHDLTLPPQAGEGLSIPKKRAADRSAALRHRNQDVAYASEESMSLHAWIRPWTEATDLASIAFSSSLVVNSTTFSTPFAPIRAGTPT